MGLVPCFEIQSPLSLTTSVPLLEEGLLALSFWHTCDASFEFHTGHAFAKFSGEQGPVPSGHVPPLGGSSGGGSSGGGSSGGGALGGEGLGHVGPLCTASAFCVSGNNCEINDGKGSDDKDSFSCINNLDNTL